MLIPVSPLPPFCATISGAVQVVKVTGRVGVLVVAKLFVIYVGVVVVAGWVRLQPAVPPVTTAVFPEKVYATESGRVGRDSLAKYSCITSRYSPLVPFTASMYVGPQLPTPFTVEAGAPTKV